MAKTYSGIDKADRFFEHYGRKGMKRGMNIYNPDYKPVGEKAQGTSDGKIAQRSISAKPTTYKSAYKSVGEKTTEGLNTGSLAPRARTEALNRWDKSATSEERSSAKDAAKVIRSKAERRADKIKEAEKKASGMSEKELEKAGKFMSLINKGLGLKATGDYKTDYAEMAIAMENDEEIAKSLKDMKTTLDTISKNLSMEEATEVRGIMATEMEATKHKNIGRAHATDRRKALLEAEKNRYSFENMRDKYKR